MSEFVNYKKRDTGLPLYCKVIFDVIRDFEPDAVPQLEDFQIVRDEVLTGTVSEVAAHIHEYVKFEGHFAELVITEPDDQINIHFNKTVYTKLAMNISIPPVSPHQQVVRSFLKRRNFYWPVADEFPKPLYPAIPVRIFRHIEPLPGEPADLARLTVTFLLHLGLEVRSRLDFRFLMIAKQAGR